MQKAQAAAIAITIAIANPLRCLCLIALICLIGSILICPIRQIRSLSGAAMAFMVESSPRVEWSLHPCQTPNRPKKFARKTLAREKKARRPRTRGREGLRA